VIYLDSTVVLSQLLAEKRQPPKTLWAEPLVSSRLLQYEVWTRIHARELTDTHSDEVARFLARLSFLEMAPAILGRAIDPFPVPVRTLDALHLASVEYANEEAQTRGQSVRLASYDNRLIAAARSLEIEIYDL
jgi:hypothetical protein